MMKLPCQSCGHNEDIEWEVKGIGLEEMTIQYHCANCEQPYTILIGFKPDGKYDVEVESRRPDYIG